jgi:hypothetical protein
VYVNNSALLEGYEWVATLDGSTTLVCAGRDGNIYPIGTGAPTPPAHWGCRSTTVPVVKEQFDAGRDVSGTRPAKGSSGAKNVSGKTTYSDWLHRQKAGFQDEVLGPGRGKLFREHDLPVSTFTDASGIQYSLEELQASV